MALLKEGFLFIFSLDFKMNVGISKSIHQTASAASGDFCNVGQVKSGINAANMVRSRKPFTPFYVDEKWKIICYNNSKIILL